MLRATLLRGQHDSCQCISFSKQRHSYGIAGVLTSGLVKSPTYFAMMWSLSVVHSNLCFEYFLSFCIRLRPPQELMCTAPCVNGRNTCSVGIITELNSAHCFVLAGRIVQGYWLLLIISQESAHLRPFRTIFDLNHWHWYEAYNQSHYDCKFIEPWSRLTLSLIWDSCLEDIAFIYIRHTR